MPAEGVLSRGERLSRPHAALGGCARAGFRTGGGARRFARMPPALAALLVQRGHGTEEAARRYLRPSLDRPVRSVRPGRHGRSGGDHRRHGARRRPHHGSRRLRRGRPVLLGAPHPRPPAGRRRCGALPAAPAARWLRLRSRRPGSRARWPAPRSSSPATAASRRWRRCAPRGRPGLASLSPTTTCPGPELPPALAVVDPQRADDTSGANNLCGTGIAFKLVQALVPALGLPANLAFHLLDLVALATVADVVPLQGENRILVRHGLKLLADSRWVGVRALVEATGLTGKEVVARHLGFVLGPRLNAAGRVADATDGLRLLLSDDPAEAAGAGPAARGAQCRAPGARSADARRGPGAGRAHRRSRARCRLRAGGRWLASRRGGDRGVPRGRAVRPSHLSDCVRRRDRQGLGPKHLALRPACRAAVLRRPARAVSAGTAWRRGSPSIAAGWRSSASGSATWRGRRSLRRTWVRSSGWISSSGCTRSPVSSSGSAATSSRAGRETPARCSACGACASPTGASSGTATSRACSTTARARVSVIGFQWADRVTWLGDDLVDAAFRIECNEWNGMVTLQARLCALSPHAP